MILPTPLPLARLSDCNVVAVMVVPARAPVNVPPVKGSLVESATVILAEPLNDTPLIVRAVCRVVAVAALPVVELEVVALPLSVAVIVPAEKLPEPSLATTLLAVFVVVASTFSVTAPEVPPPVK